MVDAGASVDKLLMQEAWYQDALACPNCLATPIATPSPCAVCGFSAHSARDLRASTYARRAPLSDQLQMPLDATAWLDSITTARPEPLTGVTVPGRDSRELLAVIRERFQGGGDVLDLGCGPRDQAQPFGSLGFRYVGIDYDGSAADLLADGHALPFCNGSFDVVFSFAVLEHLHTPTRAIAEISRVLRPGGLYVGTVSLGEPFHASYFHFTPWGLISILGGQPDLRLERLWSSADTLRALSRMGRYPRVVRMLLGGLDRLHTAAPWLAPRRMRWSKKQKEIDALYRAGSICFAISKASA